MTTIATLTRQFKMGSVTLADPSPEMTPDEVRAAYAVNYSHLAHATVSEPTAEGETLVYTFAPPVAKTKG